MIIALDARPLVRRQIGGSEQRARNILTAWIHAAKKPVEPLPPPGAPPESPHQFHLIYPAPPPAHSRHADPNFDDSLLADLPPNFHRVEISSYQLPSTYHLGQRWLNALARSITRVSPDVYHSFTPDVPRTTRCPVVPTIHDLSFELDPVVRRTSAGKELHRITAQSAQLARRIIAISSQTKYDIASIFGYDPDHIDLVYNGIDPAFTPAPAGQMIPRKPIHLANGIKGPYVLSVGADIPRRNYARLLRAMRQVWAAGKADKEIAAAQWVLAGRDDWKISDIYDQARKAGCLERMRFVRSPSNVDLADLYRGSQFTCCASSFEGFGLSVLESMACGAAVACSDMRSLKEVAEDAAVYFPHDDPETMGQAILGLLEDAEYRRTLKYRGIFRARLFTWQTAAQLTLASLAAAIHR